MIKIEESFGEEKKALKDFLWEQHLTIPIKCCHLICIFAQEDMNMELQKLLKKTLNNKPYLFHMIPALYIVLFVKKSCLLFQVIANICNIIH